jgi:YggT family protein
MAYYLIQSVNWLCGALQLLIFVRAIASFIAPAANNQFLYFIFVLTEPILGPMRWLLEKSPLGGRGMMIDLSPILAFIAISFVRQILISIINSVAM